jgi:hypothetical protein
MENLIMGLVSRIVLNLCILAVIENFSKKPKEPKNLFFVPHWGVTTVVSLYYFTQISDASMLMIGFISLDYIVAIYKYFEKKRNKPLRRTK